MKLQPFWIQMKTIFLLTGIIAGLLFVSSCGDDDEVVLTLEEEVAGDYTFTSSQFVQNTTFFIPIDSVTFQETIFNAGSSANDFVGTALLETSPCSDPNNSVIRLEVGETSNIYQFVCPGEDITQDQGAWTAGDDQLVLTVTTPDNTTIGLSIGNLVVTDTDFSGRVENFPLVQFVGIELAETIIVNGDTVINIQTVPVDVVFDRVL